MVRARAAVKIFSMSALAPVRALPEIQRPQPRAAVIPMPATPPTLKTRLKAWAAHLKRDVIALWLAARDPGVPWYAKAVAGLVAAYALSPIDLIPDFVPVLGYLDDLILVPLGILLALRLIPADRMAALRVEAEAVAARPVSRAGFIAILLIWLAGGAFALAILVRSLSAGA